MIQMWQFIKFLGMILIILILFSFIFTIINSIITEIKGNIVKREMFNELSKKIKEGNIAVMTEEEIKNNGIMQNEEDDK